MDNKNLFRFSLQGAKTGKDNGFSVLFDIESFDYGYYDEGSEGLKVSFKLSRIWWCIFCLILLTARHPVYCGLDNTDFYFQDIYFQAVLIIIYFLKKKVRQQAFYIFSKEKEYFQFV